MAVLRGTVQSSSSSLIKSWNIHLAFLPERALVKTARLLNLGCRMTGLPRGIVFPAPCRGVYCPVSTGVTVECWLVISFILIYLGEWIHCQGIETAVLLTRFSIDGCRPVSRWPGINISFRSITLQPYMWYIPDNPGDSRKWAIKFF